MEESPGKYLKAKRESQRISLRQVANATNIREGVLKDIEGDKYEDLPYLYIKSFLSIYAKYLSLNPTEVISLHKRYVEKLSFSKSQESKNPSASARRRISVRLLATSLSAALLIALTAYIFFKLL